MKINEILSEEMSLADVQVLFADDPEQLRYIQTAYQNPKVSTWADAIDVGSAAYARARRRARDGQPSSSTTDREQKAREPSLGDRKFKRKKPSIPDKKDNKSTDDDWKDETPWQQAKRRIATGFKGGVEFANWAARDWK
jgi:hypothetical protein